jgi:hypothetical protein
VKAVRHHANVPPKRHGFRPQDEFKFISVAPIIKDLFFFSDAKLLHHCEFFVRFNAQFAFLLINIPISIWITIKGIVYYIITISHYCAYVPAYAQ